MTQNIFLRFFGWKMRIMCDSFIKIFFEVLDVIYHDTLLEICFEAKFFISDQSEPCRYRFSILKKKLNFPFEMQKANSLTFCTKMSSDRQIWLVRHWIRVEWTQKMVFDTYHHTRTCLDQKIGIDEKKFSNFFPYQFP